MVNILSETTFSITDLFRLLGVPPRVQILQVIGNGEACVCHLEAWLGLRQALISQHLMALREAGLVSTERKGRNIYYRVANPALLALVVQAAAMLGEQPVPEKPINACPCPKCNPGLDDQLTCDIPTRKKKKEQIC
jgi:DNA-binding transcriptional ArsR family regulator